jgi:thiol-disulfide isomerase/thioredoxin
MIQIGTTYGEVYLTPNTSLSIQEETSGARRRLTFAGESREINNRMSWFDAAFEKIRWGKGDLLVLTETQFANRLDSLRGLVEKFEAAYADSVKLSKDEQEILETKNKLKIVSFEQEYYFFQLNNFVNNSVAAANGEYIQTEQNNLDAPNLKLSEVPFQDLFLDFSDYQMLLNWVWQNQVRLSTFALSTRKKSNQRDPIVSDSLTKKISLPDETREYLRAFNLQSWLFELGITRETDSVLHDYKRTYPNSAYLPAIDEVYQSWLQLAPGKPAPRFEGTTIDGRSVSLADLKGKIVYTDVWATWCGPCVAEIPFSKKLQKAFSTEDEILFLNISLDQNQEAWRDFLNKDVTWKGLHIVLAPDEIQAFNKSFKIESIPQYFLFDKAGNIISLKAPRPSEQGLEDEIKKIMLQNTNL